MRGSGRDRHSRNGQRIIKDSLFPLSLFAIYLGVLLLMSGLHVGLVVMMNKLGWNNIVQSVLPVVYWGIVAGGLTLFTRKKMRDTYEEPLHRLAEATEQVANGDFSVYVPTIHTADRLDYVDVMILDFNKMVEELGSVETLKTDFVSNVSHEMKTPIAVIKNYAELLQTGKAAEEERLEYARNIEEAAGRLSDLISNILKLNKLENQRIDPEIERYDLCAQLEECILNFEELWDEKELEKGRRKVKLSLPTSLVSPFPMDIAFVQIFANASAAAGYDFDNLMIPFFCVSADVMKKQPYVSDSGDLGTAIRASMTFPAYFKPVMLDSLLLFDGGFYNNFPWEIMRDKYHPDVIIGAKCVKGEPISADQDDLYKQLETVMTVDTDYDIPESEGILISGVYDYSLLEFDKIDELVRKGYDTAMLYMDECSIWTRSGRESTGAGTSRRWILCVSLSANVVWT